MVVRELRPAERGAWLLLRRQLWPEDPADALAREQDGILADPGRNAVLVAVTPAGDLAGFVEVAVRDWAEGCTTRPVGYSEAWYVDPAHRRTGVGRGLVAAAEDWARGRGCTEMGSDAVLDNSTSHAAHAAVGYREVVRLVLFRKRLT